MSKGPIWPLRLVQHRVEKRPVIVSPFERVVGVRYSVRQKIARFEIFHLDRVSFVAFQVGRVSQQPMIRADRKVSQAKVLLSFGQYVAIEQNLFLLLDASVLTAVNRIRLAFFGARVIEIVVALHRNREVRLLDAAENFAIQSVLKRLRRRHRFIGEAIFGLKIRDHVRIGPVAQPEVVVDARVTVMPELFGDNLGAWRYWLSSFPIYNSLTSSR